MTGPYCISAFPHRVAAGLAILSLVILAVSPATATFGPRVIIGGTYQQTSNTTSPTGLSSGPCINAPICGFLFQTVPQQQQLVIEHVACKVQASAGTLHEARLITRKGTDNFPFRRTPMMPTPAAAAGIFFIVGNVAHPLDAGERPIVVVENTTNADHSGECSISGRIVAP
jgi:hypothetical protein